MKDEGGRMKADLKSDFIPHPSAFILALLRDGVTGNTSGFELEDEGSTPSPAANLFKRIKVLRFITLEGISDWR